LLTCCASELAAQVLVVGHHGSRTSSRRAFLLAVGASVFVVSSGPKKYSGVTLPDPDVVAELEARGQVFRTDVDDAACAANAAKIGPDADRRPGGCDNVRVLLGGTPPVQVSVFQGADPP
jgi:competence protein ComEC